MYRNATLNVLRKQADHLIVCIKDEKEHKSLMWEKAVPGTQNGEMYFEMFCASKKWLKNYRSELNTVNALIRHIKKNVK